jgi:hypothetical protein
LTHSMNNNPINGIHLKYLARKSNKSLVIS